MTKDMGDAASIPIAEVVTAPTLTPVEDAVARYIGELYAASMFDYESASPGDVGLGGIPIKQWRAAYCEGCKDMAEGVLTRNPSMRAAVLAAFQAERERLASGIEAAPAGETAERARPGGREPGPRGSGETP